MFLEQEETGTATYPSPIPPIILSRSSLFILFQRAASPTFSPSLQMAVCKSAMIPPAPLLIPSPSATSFKMSPDDSGKTSTDEACSVHFSKSNIKFHLISILYTPQHPPSLDHSLHIKSRLPLSVLKMTPTFLSLANLEPRKLNK